MTKNRILRKIILLASRILIPSDKLFTKINYRRKIGRKLNLKNPQYFSEKIQWIKLYEKNPLMTKYSDKVLVRDFVKETIGEEYLIPLIGVYDRVEDIDIDKLPEEFVIQCNHDSSSTHIVNNKKELDSKMLKFYKNRLKENYYHYTRERHYKDIKPKILITELLKDSKEDDIKDYKIFCYNGTPLFIQVDSTRFTNHQRSLFDVNWNKIETKWRYEYCNPSPDKPENLGEMLKIAEKLSKKFYFVRVDLYSVNNIIYFGELTFTPVSGFEKFEKDEWDLEFGKHLKLPLEKGE